MDPPGSQYDKKHVISNQLPVTGVTLVYQCRSVPLSGVHLIRESAADYLRLLTNGSQGPWWIPGIGILRAMQMYGTRRPRAIRASGSTGAGKIPKRVKLVCDGKIMGQILV